MDLDLDFGCGFHAEFTNSKTMTLTSERCSNGLVLDLDLDLDVDLDLDLDQDLVCSKTLIFTVFWLRGINRAGLRPGAAGS